MKTLACLTLVLGLAPVALAEPQPDFAIPETNPGSDRNGQTVSPRDYRQQVTVWYFSREW